MALSNKSTLGEGRNGTPDNGNHGHLGSTVLVGQCSTNGADQRSNTCSQPCDLRSVGGVGVGVFVVSNPFSGTSVLIGTKLEHTVGEASVTLEVTEEIDDELWERTTVSDEGTETHDVQPGHDPVVLALEDNSLLENSVSCLLGRSQHEQMFAASSEKNEEELLGDLTTRALDKSRVTGHNESDDTDETCNKSDAFHPIKVEETVKIALFTMMRLVGHEEEGKDGRGCAEREPKPSSIIRPASNSRWSDWFRTEGVGHENRSEQLGNRHTQVTNTTIVSEGHSLKTFGVVETDVTHTGCKCSTTNTGEESGCQQDVEGSVWVGKSNSSHNHGDTEKDRRGVDNVSSTSNLS